MKNVRYYMLSIVLVLLFVTGMLLSAHAEGENSTEEISAEQSVAVSSEKEESHVESSEENKVLWKAQRRVLWKALRKAL